MDALTLRLTGIACCLLLGACGSSSFDDAAQTPPAMLPNNEFTDEGPLFLIAGETLDNPTIDPGCEVSYHSNDSSVVTVDATSGLITSIAPGSTEITTTYTQNCDDKSVSVKVSPAEFPFSAWIGENDSQVYFDASATGYDFFRSRESGCDFSAYAACDHGQFEPLSTGVVTDTAAVIIRMLTTC